LTLEIARATVIKCVCDQDTSHKYNQSTENSVNWSGYNIDMTSTVNLVCVAVYYLETTEIGYENVFFDVNDLGRFLIEVFS